MYHRIHIKSLRYLFFIEIVQSKHRNETKIFFPSKGVASFYAAIKSRRAKTHEESNKLANTARQTSIAGILVSLILVSLVGTLFFFHNKLFNFLNKNIHVTNFTLINALFNSSANIYNTTNTNLNVDSTTHSKHKLHYEILSFYTTTKLVNKTASSLTTSSVTTTTQFTTRSSEKSTSRKVSSLFTTKSRTSSSAMMRYYDKLSILVDHDFLNSIFLKYKITSKKS